MRILVTHPGRQHSHQAALGLERHGLLAGYWAGVPAVAEQRARVPEPLWRALIHYDLVDLPAGRVRWLPAVPALRRLGDALLPRGSSGWSDFAACRGFDRWAAARFDDAGADAVIACEISALTTFEEARRRGRTAILDAPSIHHAAQDRLHGTADSPRLHRRIVAVKDREIELADHIVTVSELARQTYLEAGIAATKVHALPLGADLERFSPRPAADPEPGGPFTFVFAGATIQRKGFDLLLDAFSRVERELPQVRLRVVGPRGDQFGLLAGASPRVAFVGPRRQEELAAELRAADCLVLPSRNDSYGMVVAEALASGIPAIVSEMVGAKELIREGETGWIVPLEDAGRLAETMRQRAADPAATRSLAAACRRAAESATWPAYHARLADLVRQLLGGRPR